ncbi:MAG TPA: hypothetical protein PLH97_08990, partial [Verrucomicrobiota bacterium]|nr:hypothetical protein [Verrucomicrobiota bacterium]
MNRVLYIASFFPPSGGAGVQRSLKFVKLLPSLGFQPTVLTGPVRAGRWTPQDDTLLREVPSDVSVVRAEPGQAAGEEGRIQAMLKSGEAILRDEPHACLVVSMSPFPDARIASELSARTGLPWIADLRDPW